MKTFFFTVFLAASLFSQAKSKVPRKIVSVLDAKVISEANADMARQLMVNKIFFPNNEYALIDEINSDSILYKAGVRNKDQIFSVNGVKITGPMDLPAVAKNLKNSTKCDILLKRNEEMLLLKVSVK